MTILTIFLVSLLLIIDKAIFLLNSFMIMIRKSRFFIYVIFGVNERIK